MDGWKRIGRPERAIFVQSDKILQKSGFFRNNPLDKSMDRAIIRTTILQTLAMKRNDGEKAVQFLLQRAGGRCKPADGCSAHWPRSGWPERSLGVSSRADGARPLHRGVIFVTVSGRVRGKKSGTARLVCVWPCLFQERGGAFLPSPPPSGQTATKFTIAKGGRFIL